MALSPYAYAAQSPMVFVDPDGRDPLPGKGMYRVGAYAVWVGNVRFSVPSGVPENVQQFLTGTRNVGGVPEEIVSNGGPMAAMAWQNGEPNRAAGIGEFGGCWGCHVGNAIWDESGMSSDGDVDLNWVNRVAAGTSIGVDLGVMALAGSVAGMNAPVKEGIYEFTGQSGKKYVGQSGNIPRRIGEHSRSGKLPPGGKVKTTEVLGGKTAREVAEQRRIDELGGIDNLENKVNPIGPKRQNLMEGGD